MRFDDFNKLVYSNRIVLLVAIDLLMENGRVFVKDTALADLVSALKSCGNLFAESVLTEIAETAKALSQLRTCKLLEYVKRSNLDFKKPSAQESGVCPICGGRLEYGEDEPIDDGGVIDWTCSDCGATGQEGYDKVFDKHYNVYDSEGNPFSAENKQIEDED